MNIKDLPNHYTGQACTLDGKTAKIVGRDNNFATIAVIPNGPSHEWAWLAVHYVMTHCKGEFKS